MYTQSEVMDFLKEEDVKFIKLAFFDVFGKQKNISIISDQMSRAFSKGISFDASAIDGFQRPEKSDLFLHPDPSTIVILPWRPDHGKVVCMLCDITYPDGTPYERDSRHLLKTAVEYAKSKGYEFRVSAEMEFYLFKLDENGNPTKITLDNAGYMDVAPFDKGENVRRDICFTLEQMGIKPECSHHEEGPGQNEVDFRYSDPLSAADHTSNFKWVVRTKASLNGLFADFSPKPIDFKSGNGMHVNISCSSTKNTKKELLMSQMIAGILSHIAEITLFLNPCEKSYIRLGNFKAPSYISWGNENRSSLIRVPASDDETKRIEVRSPDPSANPYIVFALLIYAALDGIENEMVAPPSLSDNLFEADSEILSKIKKLPSCKKDAFDKAISSEFVKKYLCEEFIRSYQK